MRSTTTRLIPGTVLALLIAAVGCEGGAEDRLALVDRFGGGDDDGATEVVSAIARPDGSAPVEDASAAPRRIYYDLTLVDWYRRGEPLRFDGAVYQPDGTPMASPAERMRRVDVYRGVDIYVSLDAVPPHEVVYVPVFRGYWQPFLLQGRDPLRAD